MTEWSWPPDMTGSTVSVCSLCLLYSMMSLNTDHNTRGPDDDGIISTEDELSADLSWSTLSGAVRR